MTHRTRTRGALLALALASAAFLAGCAAPEESGGTGDGTGDVGNRNGSINEGSEGNTGGGEQQDPLANETDDTPADGPTGGDPMDGIGGESGGPGYETTPGTP